MTRGNDQVQRRDQVRGKARRGSDFDATHWFCKGFLGRRRYQNRELVVQTISRCLKRCAGCNESVAKQQSLRHHDTPPVPGSAVSHMRNGTVFLYVNVEAVRVEVLCHHLARLDDAVALGEFSLCEELREAARSVSFPKTKKKRGLPKHLDSRSRWTRRRRVAACRPACWSTPQSCRQTWSSHRGQREASWAMVANQVLFLVSLARWCLGVLSASRDFESSKEFEEEKVKQQQPSCP